MEIQRNIVALNSHRNLALNNSKLNKSLEKLSSGYKINQAGDDAAGLAISEKMRGQIRGLNMAGKNIQDGISLVQIAEGAMNEIQGMLQRVRELTIQSANNTNIETDLDKLELEVHELFEEINAIKERTEFNEMKILRGGGAINPRGPGGGGSGTSGAALTGQELIGAQTTFTERLVQSTLEASEQMLASDYGLTISGKTMTVSYTTDSSGGMVARVWTSSNPLMEMDTADFFTKGSLWIDEDRIIAHEMVNAVMAGSGINMSSMPDCFIEGSVSILGANKVTAMIDSSSHGSHFYSAGYVATIYLDQKIRQAGHNGGLKDLLVDMQANRGKTFEQAMKDKIGLGITAFKNDFKANEISLIEKVVAQAGVGAIKEITGLATDENLVFGNNKSNTSIVADTPNIIDTNSFTYVFKDNTRYTADMMTPSISGNIFSPISENDLMKLQIGANTGQYLELTMLTLTTDALGLADVDIMF